MSNMIWRFFERIGAQGVAFIVSIVIARILSLDAYSTVALITAFTLILQVFVDSGMGNALIQKKGADLLALSTVFYFNMAMCPGCLLAFARMFTADHKISKLPPSVEWR